MLIRDCERIGRALPKRGAQLLIERDPADAIVPLEERVEVRPPECRLPRRPGVLEFSAPYHAQRRRFAERDADVR